MHTMAFPHSLPTLAITSLLLLFLIYLPSTTLSQSSLTECGPRLLPLAACAPYVQGSAQMPVQSCCNNLRQLYDQQTDCLCLLLNDTNASSFPINRTLALQLPALCNLQVNNSTCSGMLVPPTSPDSQVSSGSNTNSSGAASPMISVAPRSSIMGFGFGRSTGVRLTMKGDFAVMVVTATAFLLTKALC